MKDDSYNVNRRFNKDGRHFVRVSKTPDRMTSSVRTSFWKLSGGDDCSFYVRGIRYK